MSQLDFVGDLPPPPLFKDIRNTRSRSAEEKAELCLALSRLVKKAPASVLAGSIQTTREWHAAQKTGIAVLNNSRASVAQLTAAIANLRRFA